MNKIKSNPIFEAIKEPLRIALFGAISTFITVLLENVINLPQTSTIIILTFVLRFADKFLHLRGKEKKVDGWLGIRGLSGF